MTCRLPVTIFFIFLTYLISVCFSCDGDDDVAVYKVKVETLWSEETFPKDYPIYRPKAQWSAVYGLSHNSSYILYRIGEVARPTVRNFAQFGKLDNLVEEGDDEPKVYDQFSAPAIGTGVGETENMVLLDGAHSLVSLISRIIPSPDWFIGVDSLNLCLDTGWVDEITLELEPLDAGAASGLTFTAPRWENVPPDPVTRHKPREPNHPASGFYYPLLKELPPIAKIQFTKVKEYTTKDLNNLARKQLLSKWGKKDKLKGLPKIYMNTENPFEENLVMSTKKYVDRLKDLEEEPVGTPQPNLPDNNVIVVTKPPTIKTTTTEAEFDSELRNLDDVVLAVAHGRKLGLGKHLPRHFRSRLHHAVNKIQPNDCLVSEWSEWTPCSVTCGFGDKYRHRTIVRQKSEKGRDCPRLTDRDHCGDINSCTHIDYFEW